MKIETRTLRYGDNIWDNAPTVTRPGYSLVGWYTQKNGGGEKLDPTTTVTIDADYYAHWSRNDVTYTITYNMNGHGTLPSTAITQYTNSLTSVLTPPNIDNVQGFIFKKWEPESYPIGKSGNLSFTAIWEEEEIEGQKFTVTFDMNGGQIVSQSRSVLTKQYDYNEIIVPPEVVLKKDGSAFKCWTTTPLGGQSLEPGTTCKSNITYFAQYESSNLARVTFENIPEQAKQIYVPSYFPNGASNTLGGCLDFEPQEYGIIGWKYKNETMSESKDWDTDGDSTIIYGDTTFIAIVDESQICRGYTYFKTTDGNTHKALITELPGTDETCVGKPTDLYVTDIYGTKVRNSDVVEMWGDAQCTLKKIGESFFCNCTNLRYVKVPLNVEVIEKGAFWGCTNLYNVDMSDCQGLGEIGVHAFYYSGILSLTIPEGITYIYDTFRDCEQLEFVSIPQSACNNETPNPISADEEVGGISRNSFHGCTSLSSIQFNGLTVKQAQGRINNVFLDFTSEQGETNLLGIQNQTIEVHCTDGMFISTPETRKVGYKPYADV